MSGDSFESRSAEDRFLTPAQWTDLRPHFVWQAHAERQQAIEAAFASAFGWLRSAAAWLAASTTGHAFARKDPAGDTAAWAQASHGKTKSI
jgi:hypothetical protein